MSTDYKPVLWNRFKRQYDLLLWLAIALYLLSFSLVSTLLSDSQAQLSPAIMLIRALGSAAFVLLSFILCIGPLARLNKRFLPLLYNRRHLGVSMFILALAHFVLALIWYHGFGVLNPLLSMLSSNAANAAYGINGIPFEPLGFAALLILLLMAATSHDFWLANLGASVWKALHMGVYLAWAMLVLHTALGVLQREQAPVYSLLLLLSVAVIVLLHIAAGIKEWRLDAKVLSSNTDTSAVQTSDAASAANQPLWLDAIAVDELQEKRGKVVVLPHANGKTERVAVFKYDGKVSAIGNACKHQNGPLGEGRIIDGCVTCPWHGYQYRPEDGCSPAPFTEKVPTYRVKISAGRVFIDPRALPDGTAVEPAKIDAAAPIAGDSL